MKEPLIVGVLRFAQHDIWEMKPDFRERFLAGIDHFNARQFWDAHEVWEELWLNADSSAHLFLQGLIQIAAAYHHLKRGTFPGAVRLFEAGLAKLDPFPALYCGIERDALVTAARQHQRWTAQQLQQTQRSRLAEEEYPRITLSPDWEMRVPPLEKW